MKIEFLKRAKWQYQSKDRQSYSTIVAPYLGDSPLCVSQSKNGKLSCPVHVILLYSSADWSHDHQRVHTAFMIRYDLSRTDASHNAIITVLPIVGFGLDTLKPCWRFGRCSVIEYFHCQANKSVMIAGKMLTQEILSLHCKQWLMSAVLNRHMWWLEKHCFVPLWRVLRKSCPACGQFDGSCVILCFSCHCPSFKTWERVTHILQPNSAKSFLIQQDSIT